MQPQSHVPVGDGDPFAQPDGERFRVVIAGAGVASLEAILALREAVGDRVEITLLAPDDKLFYRPLAAVSPFGVAGPAPISLDRLASDLDFDHVQDLLARVDGEGSRAITAGGGELPYDALLVAIGARTEPAISGAISYGGPESVPDLRSLLALVRSGAVRRIAFAVPPVARWSLPLYEVAVLTARHARRHGAPLEVVVATHEQGPLELFGERPSEGVQQLLAIEGIELRSSIAPVAASDGELRLANGERIAADAVVALPRLVAPPVPGLPQGPGGFVATDPFMRVDGIERVWAAGDITWFPIKQGGLATQQADAAAGDIARRVDPSLAPRPFAPMLRAALMTGWTPYYLRASLGDGGEDSVGSKAPLWWPPSTVAGRLLGPYLAERGGAELPSPIEDLAGDEPESAARGVDHLDALELALTAADLDARGADYAGALRWLEVAERLNVTLPEDYSDKRERWATQQRMQAAAAG